MYPMVQRQHDLQHDRHHNRHRDVDLLEQQPTVSVISRGRFQQHEVLEPLQGCSAKVQQLESADEEEEEEEQPRRPKRPLHRRLFTYVREAWTGVKSALGNMFVIYSCLRDTKKGGYHGNQFVQHNSTILNFSDMFSYQFVNMVTILL